MKKNVEQLVVLKILSTEKLGLDKADELKSKLENNIICLANEIGLLELWVKTTPQQIHTIVYEIVTTIQEPVNIYISQLDGTVKPLLIHGSYNRNIVIEQARPPIIPANTTIELNCYTKLSQCTKIILQLQKKQILQLKAITKTNNKYTIHLQTLKPLDTSILIHNCMRITKPLTIPP